MGLLYTLRIAAPHQDQSCSLFNVVQILPAWLLKKTNPLGDRKFKKSFGTNFLSLVLVYVAFFNTKANLS